MQKTWNVFQEPDSPNSASSTDANYSSDDSNCSNQTNYSMSTAIMASPPASTTSPSPISSTSPTISEDLPPPTTTITTTTPSIPPTQNPNPTPPAPALPAIKENKENPPFNYVTTPQFAETTLQRIKKRYYLPPGNNANNPEPAMRSLELLRITIQSSFDKDIDGIIRNYMETYFKPAFSNIKENLGDTVISEEVLLKMSCALLENSKTQYIRSSATPQPPPVQPQAQQSTTEPSNLRTGVKRPMTTSVSSASSTITTTTTSSTTTTVVASTPPQKRAFSSITTKKEATPTITNQQTQSVTERRVPNSAPLPPSNFQPFRGTALPNQANNSTVRRQIFWNTANVSTTTKFVLDVQANQAVGFGTDGRERLATKHPELIRYLPDAQDRNWLVNQHIVTPHNRNARFLFLVYDEVCNLLQTHEIYRNKSNINMAIMRTFMVPEFMIEKMRHFFVDLNIKSRGLITSSNTNNAVTEANTNNGSNSITKSTNASATTSTNTTTTNTITTSTATNTFVTTGNQFVGNSNSNSQLRTALLQGQGQGQGQGQTSQAQLSLFNEDTLMSNASNDYVTTTTTFNESPNLSNFSSAFQQTPKTSALSSTHATLTALLNNSSSPAVPPLSRTYITAQIGTPKNATTQVTSSSNATTVKINAVPYGNTTTTTATTTNRNITAHTTTTSNNINRNNFVHPGSRQQQQLPQTITNASLSKNITVHTTSNISGKVTVSTALPTNLNRNNTTTSTTMVSTTRNNPSIHTASNNNCRPITSQSSSSSLVRNNNFATLNTLNSTSRNNNVQGNANTIINRNTNTVSNPNIVGLNRNPIRNSRATTNRKLN